MRCKKKGGKEGRRDRELFVGREARRKREREEVLEGGMKGKGRNLGGRDNNL